MLKGFIRYTFFKVEKIRKNRYFLVSSLVILKIITSSVSLRISTSNRLTGYVNQSTFHVLIFTINHILYGQFFNDTNAKITLFFCVTCKSHSF